MKITNAYAGDFEGNGVYGVVAETADGEVYTLNGFSVSRKIVSRMIMGTATLEDAGLERATRLAEKVKAKGEIDKTLWSYWRTIYGSTAFQAEEVEAAAAADMVRAGLASEEEFPTYIRTLL